MRHGNKSNFNLFAHFLLSARRTFIIFCAFVVAFSGVELGLSVYFAQKASAIQIDLQDPQKAITEHGRAAAPLKSDPSATALHTGEVSQTARDQAAEQPQIAEPGVQPRQQIPQDAKKYEETSKRTKNSKTYSDGKGHTTVEYSAMPTSYKDGNTFKQLGTQVTKDDGYINYKKSKQNWFDNLLFWNEPKGFKAEDGPLKTSFQTLNKNEGVSIGASNQPYIAMVPQNAKEGVKPETSRQNNVDYVTYKDVWQNVDLVYEYRGDIIKENIVINKKPQTNRFSFTVGGDVTLRYSKEVQGAIEVIKDGKQIYLIPPLTVSARLKGPVGDSGADLSFSGNTITTSVNWSWLDTLKPNNYPVVIDPVVQPHYAWYETAGGYSDYTAFKSDGYICSLAQLCWQNVGTLQDNGTKTWRTVMHIPLDAAIGKEVSQAYVNMYQMTGPGWYGATTPGRYWLTWATCPGYNCISGDRPWIPITIGTEGHADITPLIQYMMANGGGGGSFILHGDDNTYKAIDPYNTTIQLWFNTPPTAPTVISPTEKQIITTTMPRLEAGASTDADGDPVTYKFDIYRGSNFVTTSGTIPVPRWTVPEDILEDGVDYRWSVTAADNQNSSRTSAQTNFTVDLRTGKDKTQTYDDVGSVSANLADGNTYLNVASHSIAALGGSIGIGLDYNTPTKSVKGLSAEYYNVSGGTSTLVVNRTDPNIDFEWGTQSPKPGVVTADNFAAMWRGYFIAPQTGTYTFGDISDDGFEFSIDANQDGNLTDDEKQLTNAAGTTVTWSSKTVTLQAGQAYEIYGKLTENSGYATARLHVRTPNGAEQVVPQDWLRSKLLTTNTQKGLTGKFYKDYDASRQFKPDQQPFYTQRFATLNTNWVAQSPSPYDATNTFNDDFLARFNGYLTAPVSGNYRFCVTADDGQRMYLNGNKILENWTDHGATDAWSGYTYLTAGQTIPVSVEYYEHDGGASVALKWDGPAGNGIIPADALSTSYKSLPNGWNLSVDADGNLPYEKLKVLSNGSVDLLDSDGTVHSYAYSNGGFKPPVNEGGTLVVNSDNTYTFTGTDGRVYQFSNDGTLRNVSAPSDDLKPAALKYEYQEQSGVPRLKKIVDGVDSARYGELFYGGDSTCQQPSGFSAAPAGYLCAFKTYDGQTTNFYYLNGKLSRVEQPGAQLTDFATDDRDRVTSIRDVLANDAIATSQRTNDDNVLTQITYDKLGRINTVKQPAAKTGDSRIEHSLEYGAGSSKRHITGVTEPNGYLQYLEYDALQRTTKLCDIAALCTTTQWHATKDLPLKTTDATGLTSTTFYDDEDRQAESYGPAPAAWYGADRKPLATYAGQIPKTATAYDEGMTGLAAAYYTSNAPQIADTLGNGQYLFKGQSLWSIDRRYMFTYQTDGNLVLYGPNGATWSSATNGRASDFVVMQGDGNMVMYSGSTPIWYTSTSGGPSSYLQILNDGNAVIYGGGTPRWATNTGGQAASTASANVALTGAPQLHTTNIATDGTISRTYGTTSPIPNQTGAWGLSLTGRMRLPTTGNWVFRIVSDSGVRVWIDDTVVLDDWKNGAQRSRTFAFNNTAAGSSHRVRIDYYHHVGTNTAFTLFATPPGGSETTQVAQYFTPNYSLATTQTTYDSVLGNRTVTTNYGSKPEYGQAQSTTVDPTGLNLSSSATYESAGSGYLRQTTRSLPGNTAGNPASSYQYYGATETRDNPCTTEVEALHQAGFMKMRTEADGDGSGVNTGITTETIYDAAGHQVAARKNQDGWTCTSYDVRGRAVQTVVPTVNGRAGRTTATNYSYQGSPFKTQSVDSVSGNTVVETDLLGRQIASTDTFGNAYTVTYDNFGKVLIKTSPLGTEEYTYDNLNRVTEQKLDGVVYASLAYDQFSRVATVTYPQATNGSNAMTMTGLARDSLLRATGSNFTFANDQTFSQNASLSVNGITTSQAHTFAGTTATNSYGYDNAGRLTGATVDQNQYAYSYATPSSTVCNQSSANLNAGKNSNRTATTVNDVTTTNCYNQADQLLASTDAQIGTPTYDDHGNTISLAGAGTPITFTYNTSDQNTAITQGSNKVEYVKSASGSVLRKKEYENNALVRSYRFVADGKVMQSCSLTDDAACSTTDKYLSLAGNVLLTVTPNAQEVNNQFTYSILNNHGDTAITANKVGSPTSSVFLYEPFGQASQSATFDTGSNPSNATSGTMGWAASPSRKAEGLFSLNIVQMGARVYLPSQGRFLQVDPVEGGTPNAYVYVFDPVNTDDYSGKNSYASPAQWVNDPFIRAMAAIIAATPAGALLIGTGVVVGATAYLYADAVNTNAARARTGAQTRTSSVGCKTYRPDPRAPAVSQKTAIAAQSNKTVFSEVLQIQMSLSAGIKPPGSIPIRGIGTDNPLGNQLLFGYTKYAYPLPRADRTYDFHFNVNEITCTYNDIKETGIEGIK